MAMSDNKIQYRPAPILLYAYHRLNKAYQGHVQVDTYGREPALISQESVFLPAAEKTIDEIQRAYTQGRLNERNITSLIETHLPEILKPSEDEQSYRVSYKMPDKMGRDAEKSLNRILTEVEKQSPGICRFSDDREVGIETASARIFGIISDVIRKAQATFEDGGRFTDKQAQELVRNSYGDDYVNLNARSRKRQENRKNNVKNSDYIVTHSVEVLDSVDGVDVTPLAEHLMSMSKNDEFPFAALVEYRSFAKATLNESGIPCIRLQLPVYQKDNDDRYLKTAELMRRVVKDTAQSFNENNDIEITQNLVAGFIERSYDQRRNALNVKANRAFVSDDVMSAVTTEDLYEVVCDWLPMDIEGITTNFGVNIDNAAHKAKIKELLDDLVEQGQITHAGDKYKMPQPFQGKDVKLLVNAHDTEGNVYLVPIDWDEERHGAKPEIKVAPHDQGDKPIGLHDAVCADVTYYLGETEHIRIKAVETFYEPVTDDNVLPEDDASEEEIEAELGSLTVSRESAETARAEDIAVSSGPIFLSENAAVPSDGTVAGVIREHKGKYKFKPSLEGVGSFVIGAEAGLKAGDIVTVKLDLETRSYEKIIEHLGNIHDDAGLSILSAAEAGIPQGFPEDIMDGVPPLDVPEPSEHRQDMRDIPFITIDPPTAKDFDDAIYVEENADGWEVKVAIADVTHYMHPETKLFEEAYKRGNSTYLPDLTIPMLPEALSNNICSLRPDEDKACMVMTMQIDHEGEIVKKRCERGLMRSRARFNYDEVQDALEGTHNQETQAFYNTHIIPAYNVYRALLKAKEQRGALNFNSPEQRLDMTDGDEKITLEVQNASHGIIEELMISANISAINLLREKNTPFIARVHGLPNEQVLKKFGPELSKLGIEMPAETIAVEDRVRDILKQAEGLPTEDDVRRLLVRCQDKAKYSSELSEHFALKLEAYTHKTSPIRRMTDWYIHALLNEACGLKDGAKLTDEMKKHIGEAAEQFSMTERRSAEAERKTSMRLAARWVEKHLQEEFNATVTHANDNGVFIRVADTALEVKSFIPADELNKSFSSSAHSNAHYKPGKPVKIRPVEADEVTGIIKFKMMA